jgi:hypothetical protein
VDRQRDPLDHELLGDLGEPRVLLARPGWPRHADVDERQLGGVGAVPAHLGERRSTVKPGVPFSTTSREIPGVTRHRVAGPVRTAVVTKSARTPLVMNVLAPLTT